MAFFEKIETWLHGATKVAAVALVAGAGFFASESQAASLSNVNDSFNVFYSNNTTGQLLTAQSTWTLLAKGTNFYDIGVGIRNTTINPVGAEALANRFVSFGFSTDPTATGIGLAPAGTYPVNNNNIWGIGFTGSPGQGGVGDFTSGVQNFDVNYCAFSGQNCQGGANAGVTTSDGLSSVVFRLTFGEPIPDSLALDLFAIRYQSITGTPSSLSFLGEVPLPAAAWLLLAGLGGMGLVARRRKAAA